MRFIVYFDHLFKVQSIIQSILYALNSVYLLRLNAINRLLALSHEFAKRPAFLDRLARKAAMFPISVAWAFRGPDAIGSAVMPAAALTFCRRLLAGAPRTSSGPTPGGQP